MSRKETHVRQHKRPDSCQQTSAGFLRQAVPSQAYFSGKVKGEEAIKAESEIGSAITHQFRVSKGKALVRLCVSELSQVSKEYQFHQAGLILICR